MTGTVYTLKITNPTRQTHSLTVLDNLDWRDARELGRVYLALGYSHKHINIAKAATVKAEGSGDDDAVAQGRRKAKP